MQQQRQLTTVNVGPPPAYAPVSQAPAPWVVTAPQPTTVSHYKHRQAIYLGVTLIVVGLLSMCFNIVDICISKHTATEHDDIVDNYNTYYYYNNRDEFYNYMSLGFVGHGFWSGMMSAVAGAFAVVAGRRRTLSQIRASLVLCVVAASFLLAQFSVSLAGAISVGFTYSDGEEFCCTGSCSYYNYYDTDALPAFCRETAALIAMESLLALASVIGGIAAVWLSVCGCRAGCCCSKSANPVQHLLVYPQMIQNGVPVAFTSIPQQGGAPNMIPVSYPIQHPEIRDVMDSVPFYVREPGCNWGAKLPAEHVAISSTEVGCFSRDDNGQFVDDTSQRRVYCPPEGLQGELGKTAKVSFDLNRGYETWIRREDSVDQSLDGLLRWLKLHEDVLVNPTDGAHRTLKRPFADFVCCRSLIVRLLRTPYETSRICAGWKVIVCRYDGILYANDWKGDNDRKNQRSDQDDEEKVKTYLYHSCKFTSYVTADDKDSKPDIESPMNSNRAFLTVVKTQLGNHQCVYSTSVSCCDATTGQPVELKTCQIPRVNWKVEKLKRHNMLQWWTQAVLNGTEKIVCGFRDLDNVVRQLQEYSASELPAQAADLGEKAWNAEVCYKFVDEFLDYVKQTVKLDYNKAVYVFKYNPAINSRYVTCDLEAANSEFAFLPSWFTGACSGGS